MKFDRNKVNAKEEKVKTFHSSVFTGIVLKELQVHISYTYWVMTSRT